MDFTKTKHSYFEYGSKHNEYKVIVDNKKIGIIKPDKDFCKYSDLNYSEKKLVAKTMRFAIDSENHKLVLTDDNN